MHVCMYVGKILLMYVCIVSVPYVCSIYKCENTYMHINIHTYIHVFCTTSPHEGHGSTPPCHATLSCPSITNCYQHIHVIYICMRTCMHTYESTPYRYAHTWGFPKRLHTATPGPWQQAIQSERKCAPSTGMYVWCIHACMYIFCNVLYVWCMRACMYIFCNVHTSHPHG